MKIETSRGEENNCKIKANKVLEENCGMSWFFEDFSSGRKDNDDDFEAGENNIKASKSSFDHSSSYLSNPFVEEKSMFVDSFDLPTVLKREDLGIIIDGGEKVKVKKANTNIPFTKPFLPVPIYDLPEQPNIIENIMEVVFEMKLKAQLDIGEVKNEETFDKLF